MRRERTGEKNEAINCWKLKGNEIAKAVAHVKFIKHVNNNIKRNITTSISKLYDQKEFLADWELSLPKGVVANKELLQGIALEIAASDQAVASYVYVPIESSGSDLVARMKTIFAIKSELLLGEIQPYIKDIKPKTTNSSDVSGSKDGEGGTREMSDAEFLHAVLKKRDDGYYILSGSVKAM